MHSGMVSIVGRPNVGKSSLLNALVGRKVAIVSHKPQTTRHRIQGVVNAPGGQIVFIDTPGLHREQSRALNRRMNQTAESALREVDLVLFVVEALRWTDEDEGVLERLRTGRTPVGLVVNKVDNVKDKTRLLPELAQLAARGDFVFVVPLSALKRDNTDSLVGEILKRLPDGPPLYPEGQVVGHDIAFAAAEIVREKLTRSLHQEPPYALTVEVEKIHKEGKITHIEAVIWVERDGQKKIVIGAEGATLKGIGTAARRDIQQIVGNKVFLKLWCRVKENWSDDPAALNRFGYGVE